MTNSLTLYGLTTQKGTATNVSPYAWKTAVCLGLLGIPYTWEGKTFEEIRTTLEEESGISGILVPAVNDEGTWVWDSLKIVRHFDKKGELFLDEGEARTIEEWADTKLRGVIAMLLIPWLYEAQDPASLEWFIKVKFGGDRAAVASMRDSLNEPAHVQHRLSAIREALEVIEERLKQSPFLSGVKPGYADAVVWGWYATSQAIKVPGFNDSGKLTWRSPDLPHVRTWVDAIQKASGIELALLPKE
ncbi:hypothetical protein CspeluHIS016_0205110 [Cutaneotrichosporon spelunceum]|uniref:GST C-terminal domain-containing protein n=1 Tax=Cutaneotrichosporon spelunceum TaxID=1672016 RepID=A0AAD3TRE1_9TREE|nr:hypothetical protein CspeluHIS016_0205110 [Cutaneotrichosporon spelunceum]